MGYQRTDVQTIRTVHSAVFLSVARCLSVCVARAIVEHFQVIQHGKKFSHPADKVNIDFVTPVFEAETRQQQKIVETIIVTVYIYI